MRLLSGTVAVVVLLTTTSGLVPPPAGAATYTESGIRCTKVGTTGDDLLVGTSSRDVICGRGGDDTIRGLGGNDLIDAGPGNDEVSAGGGEDRVFGGRGADDVAGGAGADDLFGGGGLDEIVGGGGGDLLAGQDGNDDLAGGLGPDDVRGGPGTNWCTIDSADVRTRCVYDLEPAEIVDATLSKDTVDVTRSDEEFRVRVHVTDDTGVVQVSTGFQSEAGTAAGVSGIQGRLISGTVRDGIWEVASTVKRWSVPGTFTLDVNVRDRLDRWSWRSFPATTLTVKDGNPDVDPPQVTLLQPLSDDPAVDVRSSSQGVVVKARVTDAVSGVWYVSMCLLHPQDDYYTNLQCENASLVSGDIHNGVWRQVLSIPRGATGGDWNVEVAVTDRARSGEIRHMGPDQYRSWTQDGTALDPWAVPFSAGRGRFQVHGTTDSTPAVINEVQISPNFVNTTLDGPATVTVRMHATDAPGEGVSSIGGAFSGGNPDGTSDSSGVPTFRMDEFTLVSGTRLDGWWEGQAVLPQGTPAGTYYLQAWITDARHWRSYVSQPSAADPNALQITGDATVVVAESSQ